MSEGKSHILLNFLIRAIVGMVIIFFANDFLASQGIEAAVGLNPVSFITSGTMGIPGVALLYGIVFYRML